MSVADTLFDPYMAGWYAAIEDAKEQLARMDAWRRGEGEICVSCERALWQGLSKCQIFQEAEFREGYMARWAIEVENFGDRLFA